MEKLVIRCSSAYRDNVGNLLLRTSRDIVLKAGVKPVWISALLLGYSREYIEKNYDSIIETLKQIPEDKDAVRGYIGQSLACEKHDVRNLLHKIEAKTLVMYGEKDIITPPSRSEELGKLIPNATVRCFKDVGHGFWRERQKEVTPWLWIFFLISCMSTKSES